MGLKDSDMQSDLRKSPRDTNDHKKIVWNPSGICVTIPTIVYKPTAKALRKREILVCFFLLDSVLVSKDMQNAQTERMLGEKKACEFLHDALQC